MHDVRDISIYAQATCFVDDDGFSAIERACPDLVSSCVQCYPLAEDSPAAPAVYDIVSLMGLCLDLRHLWLPALTMMHVDHIVERPYVVTGNR